MPKIDYAKLVRKVDGVPALSQVYYRAAELIKLDTTSAADLARVIEQDPGLTIRLLRAANAADRYTGVKVTTVTQAICSLGFRAVQALTLSASVMGAMRQFATEAVLDLWKHSYASASAARLLATRLRIGDPEEGFSLGLVQNVGQIILQVAYPDEYREAVQHGLDDDLEITRAERNVLGVTHPEVGHRLATRWKLPDLLAECIKHHHNPDNCTNHQRHATVVHLSDAFATALALGSTGDPFVRETRVDFGAFWLNDDDLTSVCAGMLDSFHQFEEFYSLTGA